MCSCLDLHACGGVDQSPVTSLGILGLNRHTGNTRFVAEHIVQRFDRFRLIILNTYYRFCVGHKLQGDLYSTDKFPGIITHHTKIRCKIRLALRSVYHKILYAVTLFGSKLLIHRESRTSHTYDTGIPYLF